MFTGMGRLLRGDEFWYGFAPKIFKNRGRDKRLQGILSKLLCSGLAEARQEITETNL